MAIRAVRVKKGGLTRELALLRLVEIREMVIKTTPKARERRDHLRIPSEHISTIEANKIFYHFQSDKKSTLKVRHLECFFMLASPSDLGNFTGQHADVEIRGFLGLIKDTQTKQTSDYIDVDLYVHDQQALKGFGGVSGGGLWRVRIFVDDEIGEPDWIFSLEGVAYWAFPIQGTSAIIRCHGAETLRSLIERCQTAY